MTIRIYPGRTEPFVSQKAPRSKGGRGMGIGAVVFLIALLGILLVAAYLISPLMEDLVFPDIGIPYSTLFLIILGCIIVASIIGIAKSGLFHDRFAASYKEQDPSIYMRVIREGYDGAEFIITGDKEDTFAQACSANWQFVRINQKSKWFVKDEKGNDVTDRSLESVDGVFFIIPEYGSEILKEESDESDEYTSIHDSVEYYD